MNPRPPVWAERFLSRALRPDPGAAFILGDLREDYARRARSRGAAYARRRYALEALALGFSRGLTLRLAPFTDVRAMFHLLSPRGLALDLAYAGRTLRRNPGFVVITAAVIGLGVGATTTVFSVLRPFLIAPLPVEAPEELVWVALSDAPADNLSAVTHRSGNLRDFREQARTLEGAAGINAFSGQNAYTLEADGIPERLVGYQVTHDLLDVLGVRPAVGRWFSEEESTWDGPAAVVLSHGLWQQRFGGDPGIVGRAISLNGVPTTVAGVLPASFDFGSVFTNGQQVDVLTVWEVSDRSDQWGNSLHIVARMADGATPAQVQSELDAILARVETEQPDRWGLGAYVQPLQSRIVGPFRSSLLLLAAAAGMVLLIVCVNVSNMLLARSPGRAREMAVRKAMGATRVRLVRQLLVESTAVALLGAGVGALIAFLATRFVAGYAGIRLPLMEGITVNFTTLAFAGGVSVLTGLVVGLAPALQVSEGGEAVVLRAGGRTATSTRSARRLREGLVVAEVALAAVLLVSGGLLLRSFQTLLQVDLGFDPAQTVAWQLNPSGDFQSNEELHAYFAGLQERVAQVPGVESVGMIDALPLGRNRTWGFEVEGMPETASDGVDMFPHVVTAEYFETMRIGLEAGRYLQDTDVDGAPRVIVINEEGAERMFGSAEAALGARIVLWTGPWEIVGVTSDVRHVSPESGAGLQVYFTMSQMPDYGTVEMAVRSNRPVPEIVQAVAAAARELDAGLPMREFWTLESTVDNALSPRRFLLLVLTAFGGGALLLAGLGVYGVLAYSVAERKAEIGIRMALGASGEEMVRRVMGRTLALASLGIAAGLILSWGVSGLLSSLLFGVQPGDPLTLVAMTGTLLIVAAAAGALPALRASRQSALRVLQTE